jgi:hypothetical protein
VADKCLNSKCDEVNVGNKAFCLTCWAKVPWDLKAAWRKSHSDRVLVKIRQFLEELTLLGP